MAARPGQAELPTVHVCTCPLLVCRWLTEWEGGGGTTLPSPTFSDVGLEQNHHLLRPCILPSSGQGRWRVCLPREAGQEGSCPCQPSGASPQAECSPFTVTWVPPFPPFFKESRKANAVARQASSTLVLALRALAWPFLVPSDPRSCSCDCRTMTTLE